MLENPADKILPMCEENRFRTKPQNKKINKNQLKTLKKHLEQHLYISVFQFVLVFFYNENKLMKKMVKKQVFALFFKCLKKFSKYFLVLKTWPKKYQFLEKVRAKKTVRSATNQLKKCFVNNDTYSKSFLLFF